MGKETDSGDQAGDQARDQMIQTGTVFIPGGGVTIRGAKILGSFDARGCRHRKPAPGLIYEFAALWDKNTKTGTDEAIRSFVQNWGFLGILPDGRVDDNISRRFQDGFEDEISAWRLFSRRAYAVLILSRALKEGKPGAEEHWKLLSSGPSTCESPVLVQTTTGGPREFRGMPNWDLREVLPDRETILGWGARTVSQARSILASELHTWMERFPVSLSMEWSRRGGWDLKIHYHGRLLAAMSLQLALAVAGGELYCCSAPECGRPYLRLEQKKPARGKDNYCPGCKGAGLKQADERRREKIRKARLLAAAGVPIAEIVQQLGVRGTKGWAPAQTVRRWIRKGK